MSCEECIRVPRKIRSPQDLKSSLRKASELVNLGKLEYVGKGHWGDFVTIFFKCTSCDQMFHLHAETYHGSGGAFEAIEKIEENEKFEPETLQT